MGNESDEKLVFLFDQIPILKGKGSSGSWTVERTSSDVEGFDVKAKKLSWIILEL